MTEINVRLMRDGTAPAWSVEIDGRLTRNADADAALQVVRQAMTELEVSTALDEHPTVH